MTQALNMLPVGQIDGGRVTQTGFGRRALGATSLGVYLGLSLGVIASSLSLSWGLYVLICQRTPEFSPQDDVTEVSPERQQVALLLIFLAIMVLLPGVDVNAASQDVMPMLGKGAAHDESYARSKKYTDAKRTSQSIESQRIFVSPSPLSF